MTKFAKTIALLAALLTGSAADCLAGESSAIVVEIESPLASPHPLQGYLRRANNVGLAPAVVLLHSCHGNWKRLDERWGKRIASWGYVVLTVDSLGPRGLTICDGRAAERFGRGRLPCPELSGARSIGRSRSCCRDWFCERRPGGPDVGRAWPSGTGIDGQVPRGRCVLSILPWIEGRDDRAVADPDRRTRRLGLGQGMPRFGRRPARLGDIAAKGQGRADQADGASRRLSRIRCAAAHDAAHVEGASSRIQPGGDGSIDRRRCANFSMRRSAPKSSYNDHQSRCVRRLWNALRRPVGGRRHRGRVSRLWRHHHPGLAHQAARIYLAALADAALPGFLRSDARLAGLHA